MELEKIYADLPILETDRLILRKLSMEDAENIYSYGSNEEVSKYVTWDTHRTVADTKEYIEYVLRQYENGQIAPWGIEYKLNKQLIGTIDFVWWKPRHKSAEIGYVLHQDYWGKGITTEAARALLAFGFKNMELIRIQARCLVENIGSRCVMEKIGMSYEGTLRKELYIKGKHWDINMFSILKEEFEAFNLVKKKQVNHN